ncbi:uncharacterized protein LOC120355439 [Nilaparvata lugens]|uniref:uncharacterized protein LOC120355439 n=1 Tax=Nilaparvata lugens TaxID=108931 RepID=UPI00193D7871|nr:uncharacterized protein LOC120355439 [Nilaparvata lugens]
MGYRLRKLKSQKPSIGGKGRLTDKAIQTIQKFYGYAIRNNSNSVKSMENAIWATYNHLASSDESPKHDLCLDDWCKYKQALNTGSVYSHKSHFHIPETVMSDIEFIFKDLSRTELLKKCTAGKTQNSNESFNSVVWTIVPKKTFVQMNTLNFGMSEAINRYNEGHLAKVCVLEEMGLRAGKNTLTALKRLDHERVSQGNNQLLKHRGGGGGGGGGGGTAHSEDDPNYSAGNF